MVFEAQMKKQADEGGLNKVGPCYGSYVVVGWTSNIKKKYIQSQNEGEFYIGIFFAL